MTLKATFQTGLSYADKFPPMSATMYMVSQLILAKVLNEKKKNLKDAVLGMILRPTVLNPQAPQDWTP